MSKSFISSLSKLTYICYRYVHIQSIVFTRSLFSGKLSLRLRSVWLWLAVIIMKLKIGIKSYQCNN